MGKTTPQKNSAAQGKAASESSSQQALLEESCSLAISHMKQMAPVSVQNEEILPQAAIMCHTMLLNSVLERSANRFVEAHGLTFPQWMALGCIGHCGEEGIRHAELGNRLMLSKAPVTGVVDRLERGGYVHRVADVKDRRVSRVVITPQGEAAWRDVRQTLRERSIKLCECLSDDEQMILLNLLTRLLEEVAKTDPILSRRSDQSTNNDEDKS
jgi:MarR family 2-MHQ and catechol resistance regulon transcriptional repressor